MFRPSQARSRKQCRTAQKIEALSQELVRLKKSDRRPPRRNHAANPKATDEEPELEEKVGKAEESPSGALAHHRRRLQFRADSLWGETSAFTDVSATFANAQASSRPPSSPTPRQPLGGADRADGSFAQNMNGVQATSSPRLRQPNAAMMGASGNFAARCRHKPRNDTRSPTASAFDLSAKATQDVTVNAPAGDVQDLRCRDDDAVTNGGARPSLPTGRRL